MHFEGTVFKYGRDVDTDVIIPARYLNSSDHAHLAAHAMEDLDPTFLSASSRATSWWPRRTSAAGRAASMRPWRSRRRA